MLIALVGLPGVGKSALGKRLARSLGLDFVDCDALIEARLGRPIRTIFAVEGEAAFRDAEAALLAELVGSSDAVISTGGGIVLRRANRELLRERTFGIYLRIDAEVLARRLANDIKRPLLQVPDRPAHLRSLSDERDAFYREAARVVVETGELSFLALARRLSHVVLTHSRAAQG